ncbi:MAG: glycosyltransferase [Spirochaeta sp. LUC14_002_19_P3]|nr:MAG: glycosyltransferase [Spirochaeta sp. LUC14_002_19_P3]
MFTVSIIIPCFNEEEVISSTFNKLREVLSSVDWEAELIFVNDGSRDNTLNLLKKLRGEDTTVRILSFARNFGHQSAVSAGLKHAKGDAAIIIDADLQDPPELMNRMVEMWRAGQGKIIHGKRTARLRENLFKKITAKLFYRLINILSDVSLPLDTGDFRLIDRQVIDSFNQLPEHNKYIRGLFPWLGYKAVPLEYKRDPRTAGVTKYTMKKMTKLAANGLLSFSKKPLSISISIGMFSIIFAILFASYALLSYFSPKITAIPGWTSTLIVIIFFSGFQILILGILGSYIGMIFDEVKGRPEYVIEEII